MDLTEGLFLRVTWDELAVLRAALEKHPGTEEMCAFLDTALSNHEADELAKLRKEGE
jgi:hypothetical protein